MSNILIIKHGSLGDIAQASGAIQDISENHKNDQIFLLTTKPYFDLFKKNPFIQEVILDKRLPRYNLIYLYLLMRELKKYKFSKVIDLQNSQRTMVYSFFFRILTSTKWNGTRFGATIRYIYDPKNPPHVIDGLSNQIKKLGVNCYQSFYLDWFRSDYDLPDEIKNIL